MSKLPGMMRRYFRRFFFFFISASLCFTAFSPLPRTEPAARNSDTGEYFLPDYGSPRVAAHRIGKGDAPENTLMAVQTCLASDNQPDVIETDLECTKDGELVLFHDLYLDEKTDSQEVFGRKHVTVFSKTYAELRELNMGEAFKRGDEYPYAGLRGDDVPDELRMVRIEDVLDTVEAAAPGRFRFVMEIKFPFPWAPKMVDRLYSILSERELTDRVIVGSYWPDVSNYIDLHYAGKLLRSANPFEIIDFYGCFKRGVDLSDEEIPFMAMQLPYYWKNGEKLLLANFGQTAFIDYAHKYGISAQYFTVNRREDMLDLCYGGVDMLMTDHPDRAFRAIRDFNESEEE